MKKGQQLPPAKGKGFHPSDYAKSGVSEAEIVEIKASFDMFDSDGGGSVDTKGKYFFIQSSRPPWSPSASTQRTAPSSR